MKVEGPLEADRLTAFGTEAVEMLCRGDIDALATSYGYALSYGRDAVAAIREDLGRCLSRVGATALAAAPPNPVRSVKYYEPRTGTPLAVVECLAPTSGGASLLVELVVTQSGPETHVTLEDISVVA